MGGDKPTDRWYGGSMVVIFKWDDKSLNVGYFGLACLLHGRRLKSMPTWVVAGVSELKPNVRIN